MFANAKAFLAIVSCALAVQAVTTTGSAPASQTSLPAGLDGCILNCVTTAAASTDCGTFTNLTCVCTSTTFQSAALNCLTANCPQSDLAAATQIQQQECGSMMNSSSTTGSAPASTPSSGASSSASKAATSSSAAMALSAPLSFGGLVGTLVASAGALVGAAFVL